LISGARNSLNESAKKSALKQKATVFFYSALFGFVENGHGGIKMLPTHELTFAQQCAIGSACTLLSLRNDDAANKARQGNPLFGLLFVGVRLQQLFRPLLLLLHAERRRCGARFLLSWGIQLIFFTFNGN
jgi:hypothetical protein